MYFVSAYAVFNFQALAKCIATSRFNVCFIKVLIK
jgi:hypothetical protein